MRRLRLLSILTAVFAIALLLTACGPSGTPTPVVIPIVPTLPPWFVVIRSDPYPQVVGDATLTVTVTIGSTEPAPVTGLAVSARGSMTHAGMSPVLSEGVESDPGVYQIPWQWTMAGDWFVDVTMRSPEGVEIIQTVDIRVEG